MSAKKICLTCSAEFTADDETLMRCDTCRTTEADAVMDAIVTKASLPNLASLFRAGRKSGLIAPTVAYTNT